VPALVVAAAGDRYAIPQVNLLELVRLEGDQAKSALDDLHGTKVLRLRGQLLPLVRLRDVLGLPEHHEDHVNVVVLQADDRAFGLVVDDISDTEEIVVKPLGKELKGLGVYAGATIMGDGHIALILDVLGIAERAGLVDESRSKNPMESNDAEAQRSSTTQRLLVFRAPSGDRSAIPLGAVARLEELRSDSVERSGRDEVVQYRGGAPAHHPAPRPRRGRLRASARRRVRTPRSTRRDRRRADRGHRRAGARPLRLDSRGDAHRLRRRAGQGHVHP
jgi:two-component system chemotaxis sensor kinase CheA